MTAARPTSAWLGAGAIAFGLGAALASGTATADATGSHPEKPPNSTHGHQSSSGTTASAGVSLAPANHQKTASAAGKAAASTPSALPGRPVPAKSTPLAVTKPSPSHPGPSSAPSPAATSAHTAITAAAAPAAPAPATKPTAAVSTPVANAATPAGNPGGFIQTLIANVLGAVNGLSDTLTGRPLIGNGAAGTTNAQGVGTPGGPGGWLAGNGGAGGNSTASGVAGGIGGSAGLFGAGGPGGSGGWNAEGGAGGAGGLLLGDGGPGGAGGAEGMGGAGGNAVFVGSGGPGGTGGELAQGGAGGHGGFVAGNGGPGGSGGVLASGGSGGASGLMGQPGATGAAGGPPSIALTYSATNEYTTVGISVGGGPITPTEIDTGSSGLEIPITQVNADNIGQPTGVTGMTEFGSWGKFYYTEYKTSVDFGNGLVTAPTDIGVITRVSELINGTWTDIPQSEWSDPKYAVDANMGVCWGTDSGGLASPVHALPGSLDQGLLLNEPAGQLVFGANPLPPVSTVSGWYSTTLDIQTSYKDVQSGVQQIVDNVTIDSGGLGGNIPDDVLAASLSNYHVGDYLPAGTTVSVYTADGQTELYTMTVSPADYTAGSGPSVSTKSDGFNTGIFPFLQGPIYFSYTPANQGTTTFDYPPAA